MSFDWTELDTDWADARKIGEQLREVFSSWGYSEVGLSTLLGHETFREWNDLWGDLYKVIDERGRVLFLKPDMTVPIAQRAGTKWQQLQRPLRICYLSRLFCRPGQRRIVSEREFLQAGVELIGESSPQADAEMIAMAWDALEQLGFDNMQVNVGDMAVLEAVLKQMGFAEDKLQQMITALRNRDLVTINQQLGDKDNLKNLLLPSGDMPRCDDVVDELFAEGVSGESVDRLQRMLGYLTAYLPEDSFRLDLSLVREMPYYTGSIFEIYCCESGEVLAGGGRYDQLIGHFGPPEEAVGFAVNLDVVVGLVSTRQKKDKPQRPSCIVIGSQKRAKKSVEVGRKLRRRSIPTVIRLFEQLPTVDSAASCARERGFDRMIMVGDSGEQQTISLIPGEISEPAVDDCSDFVRVPDGRH